MKLLIPIFLFCALQVNCTPAVNMNVVNDIPLSSPEIQLDGNIISWDVVKGAKSYEIVVNDKVITLPETSRSYNLALQGYGTYNIKIRVIGNAGYSSSPYSDPLTVSITQYAPDPELPVAIGDSLRAHPRLLFPKGLEREIRQKIWEPEAKMLNIVHKQIEKRSNELLNIEPHLKDSLSGISIARENLGRIFYLSYMYRMTELERYAARAERELLAIAKQYDIWRPTHFLTTSEMTLAFAIGYDWLYDFLSEESKEIIVDAIITKGLKASETAIYKHSVGNWNSVCNACMIAGALAVYEHQPEKCSKYITEAIMNNRKAVETFGPHGGYPEGYSYWHFGTVYQTMLFELLKTAIGYESVLPDNSTGFDQTGAYALMMTTPTGHCFSYADVTMGANQSCALFWLARHYNRPDWLYIDRKMILADGWEQPRQLWRFNPCILIYSIGLDIKSIERPSIKTWYSDGNQPLYMYRSGFDSPSDVYLGVKGGYPKQGHSHMDSGAFYYERDGVIWSGDPGSGTYNLTGTGHSNQNGARWDVFHCGLSAHSTIWFDDSEHIVTAKASIIECFEGERYGAVVDLGTACADKVSKAQRTIYLEDDVLHVIDDVHPIAKTQMTWNMLTTADATITADGRMRLDKNGRSMMLEVQSPVQIQWFIAPAEGSNGEGKKEGYCRVGFTADLGAVDEYKIHTKLFPL